MARFFKKVADNTPKPIAKPKNNSAIYLVVFLVVLAIVFGGLIAVIDGRWQEIKFSIQHPEFVNELRLVYEHEHKQADENVLLRQRTEFGEATSEAGESAKK